MIYEETVENACNETRAVIECDKPGCPSSLYMPGAGAFTASERMRLLGWEVSLVALRNRYAARCPEHAEGPPVAHEHSWQHQHTLGFTACRMCGTRATP